MYLKRKKINSVNDRPKRRRKSRKNEEKLSRSRRKIELQEILIEADCRIDGSMSKPLRTNNLPRPVFFSLILLFFFPNKEFENS